jgi:hypothetical protein
MSIQSYPTWRYHSTLAPVIVLSAEEDAQLGSGWADTPAAFEAKVDAPVVTPAEVEPKTQAHKKHKKQKAKEGEEA